MSISRAIQLDDHRDTTVTTAHILNGLGANVSQLSLKDKACTTTVMPNTVATDASLRELTMHQQETASLNIINSMIFSHRLHRGESNYLTLSEQNQQWYKGEGTHQDKVSRGRAIGYAFVILHDEAAHTLTLRTNVLGHYYLALKDPQEVLAKIADFKTKQGLPTDAILTKQQNHAIYTQGQLSVAKVVAAGELAFSAQGELLAVTLESGLFHVPEESLADFKPSIEKAIRAFPALADKPILYSYKECCAFWETLKAADAKQAQVSNSITTIFSPKPARHTGSSGEALTPSVRRTV